MWTRVAGKKKNQGFAMFVARCLISASLLLVLTACRAQGAAGRCGFLLTAPKVLLSDSEERLCVTLDNVTSDVRLTVSIMDGQEAVFSQTEYFGNASGRCFPVPVPRGLKAGERTLRVDGVAGGGTEDNCTMSGTTQVYIQVPKTLVYIQSDKPIYKPGQTVQFRILSLKSNLQAKDVMISLVTVEDASRARVMQWTNQTTTLGVLALSLPLATEPALGQWKVRVHLLGTTHAQAFKVQEYVLPKFEVVVNMPAYVLVTADSFKANICAKYTYGKPVKGNVMLKVCVKQRYYGQHERPCAVRKRLNIHGCTEFTVRTEELELSSSKWSVWGASMEATATVIESATGVELSGTSKHTKVERNPVVINLKDGSRDYFKPGLPFYGKGLVTRPDGTPASGEVILLSANHNWKEEEKHTTDANGNFFYQLPAARREQTSYSITAAAQGYPTAWEKGRISLYAPSTYHQVKQWYSASGSYLQVQLPSGTAACGATIDATVSYTSLPNTTFTFHYQVMARGNIVWSSHVVHHFEGTPEQSHGPDTPRMRSPRSSMPFPGLRQPKTAVPRPVLPLVGRLVLAVPVSAGMSPSPRLLVYYRRQDGETVADSVAFDVQPCFANNVSFSFSSAQLVPGAQVDLDLGADAGSLCAIGVVDKSVDLLGGSNKLTMDKVFSSLNDYHLGPDTAPYIYDDYCQDYFKDVAIDSFGSPGSWLPKSLGGPPGGRPADLVSGPLRRRRQIMGHPVRYFSDYYDSSRAFMATGMVVVSNVEVATRPCEVEPLVMYMAVVDDDQRGPAGPMVHKSATRVDSELSSGAVVNNHPAKPAQESVVDLRTYFPETWIWKLIGIRDGNHVRLRETLPHTLTDWVGSAFCTSPDTGLGVSGVTSVRAFQPFFVSLTLPYSVIRREKAPVIVTVFNYLSECLVVELTLKNPAGFRLVGGLRRTRLCVCGNEAASHTYYVTTTVIGSVNITVKAETVLEDGVCGNGLTMSKAEKARDAVTRTLIVEAEGREEEYSISSFICPVDGETLTETIVLDLPEKIVPDSARGYIAVIGDVMGPSLSGLDGLLRMPTGCGEQNMLNFAPNIFVLQYLTSTEQLTPAIQDKALGFMHVGYQRELTYRRADGSYSAFGKADEEGSTWLTAFVVKSFAQARPFIAIDADDLQRSVTWFRRHQLENGCFRRAGRVLHKAMKGGVGDQAPGSLTAYVLIAMLESGTDRQDQAVQDALLCLQARSDPDVYTAALVAYALTLYDPSSTQRADAMNRLEAMANTTNGLKYWHMSETTNDTPKLSHQPNSVDVEVTAYALLAYVNDVTDSKDIIVQGLPIVRWLTKQRNAHGGFASTQDTVVALQALAQYAALSYRGQLDLVVKVSGQDVLRTFALNHHNKLLLQTHPINVSNTLVVTTTGTGCAMFQANVRYNSPLSGGIPTDQAFDLRVSVPNRGVGDGRAACKRRKMAICVRYSGKDEVSNMAIVSVKMVSGWIPVKESLKKLKQETKLGIKRIETHHKWVNIYFDELTSTSMCLSIDLEQDMDVKNAKPSFVEVYDYYNRELNAKEKYRIRRVCGTKQELPFLSRSELKDAEENGPIEQRRLPVQPLPASMSVQPEEREVASAHCPECSSSSELSQLSNSCFRHAYKTDTLRMPVRLTMDVGISVTRINSDVTVHLPEGCVCATLKAGDQRALILTNASLVAASGDELPALHLDASSKVVPLPPARVLKQAMRSVRRRCSH